MSPLLKIFLAALIALPACGAKTDRAQSPAQAPPTAAAAVSDTQDPLVLVRSSLRAVASAQESYYRDHGTYTTDLESLRKIPGCVIQDGVTVRIAEASENGFAMEATHPQLLGASCVQWYGKPGALQPIATARDGKRGDQSPGRVLCDTL